MGIGFLTVVTASITSSFVERSRRERTSSEGAPGRTSDVETTIAEQLRQLDSRLERIEAAVRLDRR